MGSQYRKGGKKNDGELCPKCQNEKDLEEMKVTEMPKFESEQVMQGPEFQGFFDNSSRLIERALGQEFNLMEEFFAEEEEGKDIERAGRASKL